MPSSPENAPSGPVRLRPVETSDLEALVELDASYARRTGSAIAVDQSALNQSALNHYSRSGHSFVASRESWRRPCGFLLAHASWDGSRAVVGCSRLVAEGDDPHVLERLLEALVKSAYDAGAYDLAVDLPEGDAPGRKVVVTSGFSLRPLRRYERVLGSRGQVSR